MKSLNYFFVESLICVLILTGPGLKPSRGQGAVPDSLHKQISVNLRLFKSSPKNPEILLHIGNLYLQIEKSDSALFWFNRALALTDTIPKLFNAAGKAYFKKGKHKIIPLELLLKAMKKDNYSKAIQFFQKAIALQPAFPDARYNLGRAFLARKKSGDLERARRTFIQLEINQPEYKDTGFQIGLTLMAMGEPKPAIRQFDDYYKNHPRDARPLIQIANSFMDLGETKKASHYFLTGVVHLRDRKTLHNLFLQIKGIATKSEIRRYEALPLKKRGLFFRRFWGRRDPTPTTETNERFTEHYRRVRHAKSHFPSVTPPYYDDRGKIYVKYGAPDMRYISTMTAANIRENESWSYENLKKGLDFDFVERGATFQLVSDLRSAAPPGSDFVTQLAIARSLYAERAPELGGLYVRLAYDVDDLTLMDFVAEKENAAHEAPPSIYNFNYRARPLPFHISFAQFRGKNHTTRIEIYYGINLNNLTFVPYFHQNFISTLKYSFVWQDTNYIELQRKNEQLKYFEKDTLQLRKREKIDLYPFYLKPGHYNFAFRVENPEGKKLGIFKDPVTIRDFSGDSLLLSDIELANSIQFSNLPGPFRKNDVSVQPHPSQKYSAHKPLYIYYEIYNLKKSPAGKTHYETTYTVSTQSAQHSFPKKMIRSIRSLFGRRKQSSISSSYKRWGETRQEAEYLSFDLTRLPLGKTRIRVLVKDLISGQVRQTSVSVDLF